MSPGARDWKPRLKVRNHMPNNCTPCEIHSLHWPCGNIARYTFDIAFALKGTLLGADQQHRKTPLGFGRHPTRQLELRQQRILHARYGPDLSAPCLFPFPEGTGRDHPDTTQQGRCRTGADQGRLLPPRFDLPAPRSPVRHAGRPAGRPERRDRPHCSHGEHRG